jgi:DNA mismatch endonuclease (patch repair protein)
MGYRFRLYGKNLPGTPDLVFPKYRKVIFVHGCFWHGGHSGCHRASIPATNRAFWKKKIKGNMRRDRANYRKLKRLGWEYLVIWQCQTGSRSKERLQAHIAAFLS